MVVLRPPEPEEDLDSEVEEEGKEDVLGKDSFFHYLSPSTSVRKENGTSETVTIDLDFWVSLFSPFTVLPRRIISPSFKLILENIFSPSKFIFHL